MPEAQPQDDVIIETRGLSRVYPGVTALDQVNYRVYRNKVNVLIGENGAGKSTMMKMLAGLKRPHQVKSGWMASRLRSVPLIRLRSWASALFFRN